MNFKSTFFFKKSHWLLTLIFISAAVSRAQVSVTATAGTTGPTTYTTLNAAFAAINAGTHQGAISILVTGNTTEPATPTPLLASGGTSAYTSISIMPSGGSFTVNSAAAPTANRGIIELAGADNVTIDGDDAATPGTQNLSFVAASVTTGGVACIRLSSNSATGLDGANNNTIKNCIITGSRSSATSTATNYGIQFSDGTAASSSGTGAYSSLNTLIQGNTITKCYYGIHAIGNSATYLNTGTQIIRNTIGSATAASYVAYRAIDISYSSSTAGATSAIISQNDIRSGHTSGNSSMGAIEIGPANAGATITRNYIHDCINPSSSVWGMYGIHISSSTSNASITITNNIIRDIAGYPVSSLGNQYGGIGIYVSAAATGLIINNNTIAQLGTSIIGSCVHIADGSATVSKFQNNILVNNVASVYSCGLYTSGTGNISGGTVNYNDYYIHASGVFGYYNGASLTSLANWRTATSKDANSLNLLPNFVSATDLHIVPAQITYLESGGAGVAATGVSVDYDNDNRPGPTGSVNGGATAPDIGADEFDGIIPPLPPVVNSGSVTPGGNQCVAVSHNITANISAGATAITSAYITYKFNGVTQPTVALTGGNPTGTSNWTGTIPVGVPTNAQVTWTVTVADVSYTVNFNGTAYQDEPTNGASAIATSTPSPLCAGSTATLSLEVSKPNVSGAVGTGGVSISSYNNPIYSNWANNKTQILYLASELQAAGFRAGNLSSLSLNLTSASSTVRSGFTINMAHTSSTALTTAFLTPAFTQVYTNASYAPAVGVNTFAFGTGGGSSATFNWDGVSNLVIQLCWDNVASTATESSACTGDNTAFNSVLSYNRTSTTGTVVCGLTVTGTTYTQRPTLTFTGTRLTSASSYTWTDGVTNLVSAVNTQTVTLNTTTNYTATASLSGCPVSATVSALVNPPIAAPTTTNSTQCGNGIPTAMVGGATAYKWYATPTSTAVLQSGASQTYTSSISATTNFYVASVSGVCEGSRAMLTASVTLPDAVTATASSASLCPSATATLTAVQTGTTNVYSYTWTPSPVTGSGMAASVTGSMVTISPTAPGTYGYNVTASDGVCTTTAAVNVMLSNPPVVNASATPTMVCSGSTVNLNATTSTIASGTVAIGNATTLTAGNTAEPTAFCNRYTGYRMQAVYTAAELQAAGLRAGNITSIAYNITTIGSSSVNPLYTVKCGTTSVNAFTNFVSNAGFTTCFPAATYTHAVGVNVIPFSTPFNWDGVSNLVVEVTHDGVDASTSSQTYYTATAGNTIVYSNYNNATGNPGTMRLNIIFGGQAVTQGAGGLTWQWNPGAINSSTASVTPVNTGTNPATSTYTITGTDPVTTCSNSAVVSVTVNPLPTTPVATNSSQCGLGIPTASVSGGTNYKWYATPTSTTVLQSGASATFTNSINATTTWYVLSDNGICRSARVMLTASVTIPDAVTAVSTSTAICPGQSFTLTANKSGSTNNYTYTWTATPAAGSGIPTSASGSVTAVSPTAPGTYNYLVTAVDGVCTTTAAVNVMLSNPPVVNASATPTMVCSGSTVNLNATTSTIASGTVAIGNATTLTAGNTTEPTAFCNRYTGYRMQAVYTAAELQAAGLRAGNITSIAYNITTIGSSSVNPLYTVKCGTTSVNAFTNFVSNAGFTTCFPAATYTHAVGVNVIPFSTPFNWDGVSNLVVEVTHDGVDASTSSQTYYTATAGNTIVYSNYNNATGNPGTMRLNIIFGGQAATQGAGGLTWQWNPGAINSSTASVAPVNTGTNPATSTYTITGTDPVTTCSNSAVVSVTVNPVPSVPTVLNSVQCGVGTPSASVSGGATYKWYATPTSTTVLQSGASSTYTSAISATTTFYVSSYNANCESARAAVTASVSIPDAITATSTNTAVCPGQSFTLTATNTGTNNVYSYTWTATPATGSGIATSVTGATTAVTPSAPGSYSYKVTGSDAVCTTTAAVTVMLSTPPQIIASASPSVACSGSTVALNALTGTIASGTVGIGVSTMTLSAYSDAGNPYNHWYGGQKEQYIFTAAELNAAGLTAGNITALSFDVVSATSLSMANFSMTVGHTTQSAATFNLITTGLNTVYFNAAQTVAAGINNYAFSTPFNWNGTDNIVVSLSWSNVNSGSTALTASVRAHNAGFDATGYLYADNTTAASIAAATTTLSAGIGGTSQNNFTSNRPNIIFTGQRLTQGASGLTWQWNPGAVNSNTMTVSPTTTSTPIMPTYTVTAIDPATTCSNTAVVTLTVNPIPSVTVAASTGSICSGTTASLTATGATTYSWMPAGGSSSVAVVSPAANTVYTVTGTSLGCSNTQTVNLNVSPTPTVVASASPSVICAGATVSLTASGATTYSWMPNSSASGTTTATPTVSTTYTVSGTTAGCTNTKTLSVTVNNVPTMTLTTNPANGVLCTTGATATLTASGTSTAYVWSNGANTASTSVAPSATTVYSVTGTNSCGVKTMTTTIAVATTPTIAAASSSTLSCANNAAVLTASATAGVTYSWSTGASTASITVSPSVTTTYTVTGTNACGTAMATVVQNVSPCTGIEEITGAGEISIYPNPANDYVSIAVPAQLASANTSVEITDALGKVVMKETINTDVTTLRITKLEDGVYFFRVITNNQTLKVGKVVKH